MGSAPGRKGWVDEWLDGCMGGRIAVCLHYLRSGLRIKNAYKYEKPFPLGRKVSYILVRRFRKAAFSVGGCSAIPISGGG